MRKHSKAKILLAGFKFRILYGTPGLLKTSNMEDFPPMLTVSVYKALAMSTSRTK